MRMKLSRSRAEATADSAQDQYVASCIGASAMDIRLPALNSVMCWRELRTAIVTITGGRPGKYAPADYLDALGRAMGVEKLPVSNPRLGNCITASMAALGRQRRQ